MLIQTWGKSGVLAYFGPKISYFGHIFGVMDFLNILSPKSLKYPFLKDNYIVCTTSPEYKYDKYKPV